VFGSAASAFSSLAICTTIPQLQGRAPAGPLATLRSKSACEQIPVLEKIDFRCVRAVCTLLCNR